MMKNKAVGKSRRQKDATIKDITTLKIRDAIRFV